MDDLLVLMGFLGAFLGVLLALTIVAEAFAAGSRERRDAANRNHAHPRRW